MPRGADLPEAVVVLADTHPTPMPVPFVSAWLGELPWVLGVVYVCGGLMLSVVGNWRATLCVLPLWWITGRYFDRDPHALTTLLRWLQTSAWDLNKRRNSGASVPPLQLRPRVPLGIYDDAV